MEPNLQKYLRRWKKRLKIQTFIRNHIYVYVIPILIFTLYSSSFISSDIQFREELSCYLPISDVIAHHLSSESPAIYQLIKRHYLWPPSVQPYNLTDNDNDTIYAQTDIEDTVFLALFGEKKHGTFIEAGAADGETGSNTLFLERNYGWSGLLVEPNINNHPDLLAKHRKAWTSPACLSLHDYAHRSVLETIENAGQLSSLGSRLPENLYICPIPVEGEKRTVWYGTQKKPGQDLESQGCKIPQRHYHSVMCFPLHALLLAINLTTIDYFSLDVEGVEMEVLKSIPFETITIKVLQIEFSKLANSSLLEIFLQSKGYSRIEELTTTRENRAVKIKIKRILTEDFIFIKNGLQLPIK